MSKITVTTIAGLTSGGDANKVKIESGDAFQVVSGTTTLGGNTDITGNTSITGDTATLTLTDSSSHSANTGPAISFFSKDSGGTSREVAKIVGESHSGANEGNLALQTRNGGTLETKWKVFKNGNLLPSNSAYGIYLGTTVASGEGNLLDDYEEGAWVPVFQNDGSTSYLYQLGKYVKVGSMVVATYHIDINSGNAIGSNQLKIENLPFTVANSSNQYGNIGGLHCNLWSTTSKPDNALAVPNTTRLEFYRSEGVTGTSVVTGNDIGTGNLLGHVIFFTD